MVGKLRLTGFIAWLLWLAVHLVYLTGFKNRVTALLHWFVSFLGRGRSERTATEQQIFARPALRRLEEVERTTRRTCRTTGSPTGPSRTASGSTWARPDRPDRDLAAHGLTPRPTSRLG